MSNEFTAQEFRSSVLAVLDNHENTYKNSLEDYLLSFWATIEKYKNNSPSYSLFATLISEAFETQPSKFNNQWLTYEHELLWKYQDDSYIVEEYKDGKWTVTAEDVNDFEILQHTLFFQIADLHRMTPEQLKDPNGYFGINSPTGNRWYNFDVFTYWECATAGMEAHLRSPKSLLAKQFDKCTWAVLAALLKLGQIYE